MRILLIVFVLTALFGFRFNSTASQRAKLQDSVKKSFEVKPGGTLTIVAQEGTVLIEGKGDDEISVEVKRQVDAKSQSEAEAKLRGLEVQFDQTANDLAIRTAFKVNRDGTHLEFHITVPRSYNIDARTSGGGVSVTGVEGKVMAKTSGGGLGFKNIRGAVVGKTSGGGIEVKDLEGEVNVDTSGGSIALDHVKGQMTASTSGGGLRIENPLGRLKAITSGGAVTARITKSLVEDCELQTRGGSVTVELAQQVGVNLDARTSAKFDVMTDFPLKMRDNQANILYGTINGGGPKLILRTEKANIYVRKI